MIAAMFSSLLAEPETQGRLIGERQRPLRYPQDPFECLGVRRDGSLHDLEADGAGLTRDEEVRGQQLKALHERHEDPGCVLRRIDLERSLVDALPHYRREKG